MMEKYEHHTSQIYAAAAMQLYFFAKDTSQMENITIRKEWCPCILKNLISTTKHPSFLMA